MRGLKVKIQEQDVEVRVVDSWNSWELEQQDQQVFGKVWGCFVVDQYSNIVVGVMNFGIVRNWRIKIYYFCIKLKFTRDVFINYL